MAFKTLKTSLVGIVMAGIAALCIGCGRGEETYEIPPYTPPKPPVQNKAPVIGPISCLEAVIGQPYTCQIIASDPDGDKITYSVFSDGEWMSIDQETGLASGTPGYKDIGDEHEVKVIASDGKDSTQATFVLPVKYPGYESLFYVKGNSRFILIQQVQDTYIKEDMDQIFNGILNCRDGVLGITGGVDAPDSRFPIEVYIIPTGGGGAHDLLPDGRGSITWYGKTKGSETDPDLSSIDNQTTPMHELIHHIMLGLINEYSPRYGSVPVTAEDSFTYNISLLLSHIQGYRQDITSFTDAQLHAMNDPRPPANIDRSLLNHLAADYGIDAGQMPWMFAEIASARAKKGSVLNLWDLYQVSNNVASQIAGHQTDTLQTFHDVGLSPENFPH